MMLGSAIKQETIAAVATAVAPGEGGIAVIRVSGEFAEDVGRALLLVAGNQIWESHRVLYGHVIDESGMERIDEVLLLFMKGPRSFTGEDVVEFHCHGGLIVVQRVLERVLAYPGVRRALPGEFTQRAVLNGRLDFTRAEAISELISARSRRAAQLAMAGVDGGIQRLITSLRERLLDQLTELEARVDFEDDLPPLDRVELLKELFDIQGELQLLAKQADRGSLFRQGLRVAIIGRPNVGKSSLLNRLCRHERAIVTDSPGTTRDLLETEIVLEGVPIILLDTAGIRKTKDQVEQLGIDRSYKALSGADVVLLLFDLTRGWTNDDQELLDLIPNGVPKLVVGNKADVHSSHSLVFASEDFHSIGSVVTLSALTGQGEQSLINKLLDTCGATDTQGLVFALNERQKDLAVDAITALEQVKQVASDELPWDFWTIDIRQAISSLGEITGEEITEALLDRIFSRFCIGK